MKAYHIHLAINHLPVIAIPVLTVLLVIFKKLKNDQALKVALICLLVMGLSTGVIYLSGSAAEDALKGIRTLKEPLIEAHEEAGELALYLSLGLSLITSFALFNKKYADVFLKILIGVSLLACLALGRAAYFGGMISHPELIENQDTGSSAIIKDGSFSQKASVQ